MTLIERLELEPLVEKTGVLLKRAGCFDEGRNWIDIDFIWYDPEVLKEFVTNMTQIVEKLRESLKFNKLLLPDKVAGPYGILPILVLVSQKASPPIPFAIWKENGRPSTGESLIFGRLSDDDKLLLANDVINYGVALAHMKNDLENRREQMHMRYSIVGILALVDRELGGLDFVEKNTKIRPISLIQISALKKSHHQEG